MQGAFRAPYLESFSISLIIPALGFFWQAALTDSPGVYRLTGS